MMENRNSQSLTDRQPGHNYHTGITNQNTINNNEFHHQVQDKFNGNAYVT